LLSLGFASWNIGLAEGFSCWKLLVFLLGSQPVQQLCRFAPATKVNTPIQD
jgi:hypothetical protein